MHVMLRTHFPVYFSQKRPEIFGIYHPKKIVSVPRSEFCDLHYSVPQKCDLKYFNKKFPIIVVLFIVCLNHRSLTIML